MILVQRLLFPQLGLGLRNFHVVPVHILIEVESSVFSKQRRKHVLGLWNMALLLVQQERPF